MHYLHRDLRPEPGRDHRRRRANGNCWRRPPNDQRLGRGGLDRATVDEALCCAGRSLCCGCYNLRAPSVCAGALQVFLSVGAARAARLRDFLGARRDGSLATGRGSAVRSDARGSTAARALFRTALMPSWRRSCLCARARGCARGFFARGSNVRCVGDDQTRFWCARRVHPHWARGRYFPNGVDCRLRLVV